MQEHVNKRVRITREKGRCAVKRNIDNSWYPPAPLISLKNRNKMGVRKLNEIVDITRDGWIMWTFDDESKNRWRDGAISKQGLWIQFAVDELKHEICRAQLHSALAVYAYHFGA